MMKEMKKPPSESSIALLKRLIRLASIYDNNRDVFFQKFLDVVHIDSLRKCRFTELEPTTNSSTLADVDTTPESIIEEDTVLVRTKLNAKEREMYTLIRQGFSAEELRVIYGMKSVNAIYVRQHRIKKKLKGTCDPEIAVVATVLLVLASFIMHFW